MKYKLITVLYLCVCTSLIVRSDEEEEVEESGSGEEESAEEVKFSNFIFFSSNLKNYPPSSLQRLLARAHAYPKAHAYSRAETTPTQTRKARSLARAHLRTFLVLP